MLDQTGISASTPMGGTLVEGGATFRFWAPRARVLRLQGVFSITVLSGADEASLLAKQADGTWTGFVEGAADGDTYRVFVVGESGEDRAGTKRDPYARELANDAPFPDCACVLRRTDYPWHDAGFVTPDFSDMIVYQLHVGIWKASGGRYASLLDVAVAVDYIAGLGVNVLQPLPIDEAETPHSWGYNSCDFFSSETSYVVTDEAALVRHRDRLNDLLAAKGLAPDLSLGDLTGGYRQLKALVDICHVYGVAVVLDVVFNHAGGFDGDDHSLSFFDRMPPGDANDSLYFTDKGWAGGLSFALWNPNVRQFLIDNALYFLREHHADGFRYDEISALVFLNGDAGWSFCRDLTATVRFAKPRALQNAEFWPVNGDIVRRSGAGFDVTQHDGLRGTVRNALAQAAHGADARVDMEGLAASLVPFAMDAPWQAVTCIENHDLVFEGREPRVATLADGSDPRSWYARSRARVAAGLLMTAPGIPQLFMGQEFLEAKPWNDDPGGTLLLDWDALAHDEVMANYLRFMRELVHLRRTLDALRGPQLHVSHMHDGNRVIVLHRWLEGRGADVILAASLAEHPWSGYAIGLPRGGRWREVFNSDAYDGDGQAVGNGGAIDVAGPPLHGFSTSTAINIPANGLVVFTP